VGGGKSKNTAMPEDGNTEAGLTICKCMVELSKGKCKDER
jgi:hypothetical protein